MALTNTNMVVGAALAGALVEGIRRKTNTTGASVAAGLGLAVAYMAAPSMRGGSSEFVEGGVYGLASQLASLVVTPMMNITPGRRVGASVGATANNLVRRAGANILDF